MNNLHKPVTNKIIFHFEEPDGVTGLKPYKEENLEQLAFNREISLAVAEKLMLAGSFTVNCILATVTPYEKIWVQLFETSNFELRTFLAKNANVNPELLSCLYPECYATLLTNPKTPEIVFQQKWAETPTPPTDTNFYLHPSCPPYILLTQIKKAPPLVQEIVTKKLQSMHWRDQLTKSLVTSGLITESEGQTYSTGWLETLCILNSPKV